MEGNERPKKKTISDGEGMTRRDVLNTTTQILEQKKAIYVVQRT